MSKRHKTSFTTMLVFTHSPTHRDKTNTHANSLAADLCLFKLVTFVLGVLLLQGLHS